MPKIKSVHLSRVGHPSARLDGVTIYFTHKGNPYGRAEDTILALRNGGGKTSLLQLLFSTFVPDKREFSGRTSEGGERTFEQYFQANDLGLIVTEWDLGEDMPKRIVGQCVVKNSASDTDPERCFFSFLDTDTELDFKLSDLPMRQFKTPHNPGNASSLNAFKQLLRHAFATRPHQQLLITSTQREWHRHLRSWGYEPDLFRLLIALNKSEGGSKEMAKENFGTTEKMIGLIAMLSISDHDRKDGKGSTNVRDLISKYREDLNHLPEKEAEKKMWERLTLALTELIVPGKELEKAQKETSEAYSKLLSIGHRVLATPVVLNKKISDTEEEIKAIKDLSGQKRRHIQSLDKQMRWVEKEILRLILEAAQVKLEEAKQAKNDCQENLNGLHAHNLQTEVNALEGQCHGLQVAINESTEPTRDIENTLHALGFRLDALFGKKLATARGQHKAAEERAAKAEDELSQLRQQERKTDTDSGKTTAQIGILESWLTEAINAKQQLVDKKYLPDMGHAAASSLASKNTVKKELEETLLLLVSESHKLAEQRDRLINAKKDSESEQRTAEDKQDTHQGLMEKFKKALDEITADKNLCLLIESEEVDPYSPSLPTLLEDKQNRLLHEKFNLEVEQRRVRESLNFLEGDYRLMPPPEDVWYVSEILKDEGIPAYPYVKYLSEINLSPEVIRELLQKDPARYGGVCITSSRDLDRARDIAGEVASLRGPVQIYPLDKHKEETVSGSTDVSIVSLPTSDATFDRVEASAKQRELGSEIEGRDAAIEKIDIRIETIKEARNSLNIFLVKYPEGTASNLEFEKESIKDEIILCNEKLRDAVGTFDKHEGFISDNADQQNSLNKQSGLITQTCQVLETYISNYERHWSEKKDLKDGLAITLEGLKQKQADINKSREKWTSEKNSAAGEVFSENTIITDLSQKIIALTYKESSRGDIPKEVDHDNIDSLQVLYHSNRKAFEEKNESIDGLMVQRNNLKERIAEKVQERDTFTLELPSDVLDSIAAQYGDNKVSGTLLNTASLEFEKAKERFTLADNAVSVATKNRNEFPCGPSDYEVPEDGEELKSEEDFRTKKTILAGSIEETKTKIRTVEQQVLSLGQVIDSLNKDLSYLRNIIGPVKEKTGAHSEVSSSTGFLSFEEASSEWNGADLHYENTRRSERSRLELVNKKKDLITQIINDDSFNNVVTIIKQRINGQYDTLHLDADEYAQDAKNAFDSVSYSLAKTKDQLKEIVDYLFDDVRSVKSNLEALDRISKIPESDTKWAKWSGRKFFKVKVDGKRVDDGFCRTKIEEYVQTLAKAKDKSFPSSAQAIIEGVAKFSLKAITKITTMKPDHFMSTEPETLEEAAKWSGGEGFTYAALSLMVFSRLISHVNASVNVGGGILIVDNPIGTCNHLEFIKLQQIVAKMLNVQLLYPTAVKDLDALSLFPNVVSLSNNHIDAKTGFKHVRVQSGKDNSPALSTAHMTFSSEVVNVQTSTVQ
ncbi:MAG: hypothetical protein KAT62_02760 [Desulfuromonadales bacterium]|nr:hypothetical protein [Desulfuromonadales bacterium]